MDHQTNRQVCLKSRPSGMPSPDNFELRQEPVPQTGEGEILVRNIWMSVDPYMRGRMREGKSYVPPFEVGQPLSGGCIGQVVESHSERFAAGDYVSGMAGWREYWTSDGEGVFKVDPEIAPIEAYLGALGMPGMTAYVGLREIGQPQEGEAVFVSAAAGAVGSIVCQIAKLRGCRVVGSAGGAHKVAWLKEKAGVDEAVDYREAGDLATELQRRCPQGIDVYWDNVGGDHLEAALLNMNDFGRIVACGMISQYNAPSPPPGPRHLFLVVAKRLKMQGFIVGDHLDLRETFVEEMGRWIRAGKIVWEETVVEGLENAPQAFLQLFEGDKLGKMLVKIGPDPAV